MEDPVRTCLICRERRSKSRLVRLVAAGGAVIADPPARRPGRGAYVCAAAACVDELVRQGPGRLAKALRLDPTVAKVDGKSVRAAAREKQDNLKTTVASRPAGPAMPTA